MGAQKSTTPEDRNFNVIAQIYAIMFGEDSFRYKQRQNMALKTLLEQDFDINYRIPMNEHVQPKLVGYTVLELALKEYEKNVFSDRPSGIFQLFIKYGADFTSQNDNGETILHQIVNLESNMVKHTLIDTVLKAHVEYKNIINPCNKNGFTHFHIACMFNRTIAVKFFLAHGVNINQAINSDSTILPGYTPLHLAARYSAFETLQVLLDHNADLNLKNFQNMCPFSLLIIRIQEILDWKNLQKEELSDQLKQELVIREKMIKKLLEKARGKKIGLSVQHVACTLKDPTIIKRMIANGMNLKNPVRVDSPLWPGYTALHFAAHFNINIFRLLLINGADILAKDANGVTPLDLCLPRYSIKDIHSLLTSIAEWNNIKFIDERTILTDVILSMADKNTLESFLKKNAVDVNTSLPADSPLWPGYTILHIAVILSEKVHEIKDLNGEPNYSAKYYHEHERENWTYMSRIKLCLDMGADVTITNIDNLTPLHLAFYQQNRFVVDLLLKYHHKIVNVPGRDNLSHLHIACLYSNRFCRDSMSGLIVNLLKTGVDANNPITTNFKYRFNDYSFVHINPGWTCLHSAVATDNDLLAKILLKHNADLYAQDSFDMTPIHHFLQSHVGRDHILLSSESLKNYTTSFGLSHLHIACFSKNLGAVERLLNQGADIEATINYNQIRSDKTLSFLASYDGYKPFHFLLQYKYFTRPTGIIELLIKRGADLFANVANDRSPFYEVLDSMLERYTIHDYEETFMTDNIIQKVTEDAIGLTKLHMACVTMNIEKVKKLLSSGADPNAQIRMGSSIYSGCTPLHLLINKHLPITYESSSDDEYNRKEKKFKAHIKKIKDIGYLLLENGASVMLKDAQGNTPIHKALRVLYWDCGKNCSYVDWIMTGYTDFTLNPVNLQGISHFDVACLWNKKNVVRGFLETGVGVNRRFGYFTSRYPNITAMHLACMENRYEIIDQLLQYEADIHAKDFFGNTPLSTLAKHRSYGYESGMKILIQAGADINEKNYWNESPVLILGRLKSSPKILEFMLLNYSCRVNLFYDGSEVGILGNLWKFDSHLESYEKQIFYKAIVNAPNMNEMDEMGRTVIHNIVSTSRDLPTAKNYAEIISGIIKLNYEIDHQDKKGQTALHKASIFGNVRGIAGLLMNGADINLVDGNKKTALANIIRRSRFEGERERKKDYCNVLRTFAPHVYKLQIIGLKISDVNRKFVSQFAIGEYQVKSCAEELRRLKNYNIGSSTLSLYDILSNPHSHLKTMRCFRDDILEIFEKNANNLQVEFPQFAGLLQMQYRNVFVKSLRIEEAKLALNCITEFIFPDLCSEIILRYLCTKDLIHLISSATIE